MDARRSFAGPTLRPPVSSAAILGGLPVSLWVFCAAVPFYAGARLARPRPLRARFENCGPPRSAPSCGRSGLRFPAPRGRPAAGARSCRSSPVFRGGPSIICHFARRCFRSLLLVGFYTLSPTSPMNVGFCALGLFDWYGLSSETLGSVEKMKTSADDFRVLGHGRHRSVKPDTPATPFPQGLAWESLRPPRLRKKRSTTRRRSLKAVSEVPAGSRAPPLRDEKQGRTSLRLVPRPHRDDWPQRAGRSTAAHRARRPINALASTRSMFVSRASSQNHWSWTCADEPAPARSPGSPASEPAVGAGGRGRALGDRGAPEPRPPLFGRRRTAGGPGHLVISSQREDHSSVGCDPTRTCSMIGRGLPIAFRPARIHRGEDKFGERRNLPLNNCPPCLHFSMTGSRSECGVRAVIPSPGFWSSCRCRPRPRSCSAGSCRRTTRP